MTLRIECPGCQQSFDVSEELRGRTVECGSCEKRFKVTDEVLVVPKDRFYPDEVRKKADLSRFGRSPASSAPVEFRTMEYAKAPEQPWVGPQPVSRTFASIVGLLVLVLGAAALYFGSLPSAGLLRDVERMDRLILGCFLALLGFGLLCWGMKNKRIWGGVIGVVGGGGVVALAFLSPIYRSAVGVGEGLSELDRGSESEVSEAVSFPGIDEEKELSLEEVIEITRWEAEVQSLLGTMDASQVVAVWVRSMEEFHGRQIQSYLEDEMGVYPSFRSLTDGGIFVMSGIPLNLNNLEAASERFGEVEEVHPDLRLVQVKVNSLVLGEISSELLSKMNDQSDGAFYSLNFKELVSIDRSRVKDALTRLALAEPVQMRKDITVRLVGLLSSKQEPETFGQIAKALSVWSEEGDGAGPVLVNIAQKMRQRGDKVPIELLNFLAKRKTPSANVLFVELWSESPVERQGVLVEYGEPAASLLTAFLRSSEARLRRSAALALGQVGTKDELAVMREALTETDDEEFKELLQEAITRVARR